MNKETLAGKWHEIKGQVKEKWGKLTDSDIAQINGKREVLLGKLESRYGLMKEKAEKELQDFERSFGISASESTGTSRGAQFERTTTHGHASAGERTSSSKSGERTSNRDFDRGDKENQRRK
jgi:uncharacterized protein YjbJ (UPF0337 family)